MNTFKINNSSIGEDQEVYFIADIAANHDGNLDRAIKLIDLAKENGANAAKFQHHDVTKYVSDVGFKNLGEKKSHQKNWKKTIFEIYKDAEVPKDWTTRLKEHCKKIKIDFLSTPYDLDMVDHLDKFVPAFKIGSGDVAWDEMLDKVSSKNKPIFVATGAATIDEVKHAHEIISKRTKQFCLMQCNTNYTGSAENFKYINLNVIKTYRKLFPNTILGLSDHTPGSETVLGAVALGVKAVEKHFTDDTTRDGPDHPFSMDPTTWRQMVKSTRLLESAMGEEIKKIGYASGTCLFTSKSVLEKVGLLDSFLFLYHDDLDLGWRASQIGINSYYVPKSKIYHVESYSLKWSAKKFYWLERNRKYCLLTHYSKNTYAKMYSSLCLVDLFVWFFYISKGFLGAKIKAELDIRRNRKFIETKYQELEKKKTVPDEKIIQEFPDEIFVPTNVSDNFMNGSFNSVLSKLSKKVKKKII